MLNSITKHIFSARVSAFALIAILGLAFESHALAVDKSREVDVVFSN